MARTKRITPAAIAAAAEEAGATPAAAALAAAAAAAAKLVVGVIHQRVFEAFWSEGETFVNRIVVDDVLN